MPVLNAPALIEERVNAIRKMHTDSGCVRAELDVSGGVDSAVMLGLIVRAVGAENTTAIHIGINSSPDALSRAQEVSDAFGVKLIVLDATTIYNNLLTRLTMALVEAGYDGEEIVVRTQNDPTILGSIRSTLRAPIGRAVNRLTGGGLRHGTGNEDEDRVLRFYQKGGDGEVDTNPIAMLSKGEVFQLARALGVPSSILNARPSPDLWGVGEVHNDEEEIAAYLGLKGCGIPFYSYVDLSTGRYKNVGLIERLHRFLDTTPGSWLFTEQSAHHTSYLENAIPAATSSDIFKGIPEDVVRALLTNARRIERATRHKMNPNCPTLGDREEMIRLGLITNDLPVTEGLAWDAPGMATAPASN